MNKTLIFGRTCRTNLPLSLCRIQNVEQPQFSLDISWLSGFKPYPTDSDVHAKTNDSDSETQRWKIDAVKC